MMCTPATSLTTLNAQYLGWHSNALTLSYTEQRAVRKGDSLTDSLAMHTRLLHSHGSRLAFQMGYSSKLQQCLQRFVLILQGKQYDPIVETLTP
jgi:hypothetical protein